MTKQGNGQNQRVIHNKVVHAPDRVWLEASDSFVMTPHIEELVQRATAYLDAGYPINLSGPAGTGKTTLALHIASKLGQPVTLLHGDDEFGSSDLVGKDTGYRRNRLLDNYVHSVVKEEETMRTLWIDNRLTTACRYGHTLVYDEFTRSRPEANNALLSVLGEGLLSLPKLRYAGEGYLKVDPAFRAIFTSNPEEYAGIHTSQDALMDRLILIHVDYHDRDTEVAITAARGGVSRADAARIVDMVRRCRTHETRRHRPSIRASIMIARVVGRSGGSFDPLDRIFQRTCRDVLGSCTFDAITSELDSAVETAETDLDEACRLVGTALPDSV
ncbi:MAG TPA: gas vesicle protein GvpN [Thermoguttaceae bacterium]|nr:gas vesicle protein GvpN [Thermoguttaceae bacterium]